MPFAEDPDYDVPGNLPTPDIIEGEAAREIVVDTRYVPIKNLLVNIEGSPWPVTYYRQVLDSDTALSGQQTNRQGPYQQYIKIEEMILKVTSALASSQDPTTKNMSVVGSANTYPPLIPNMGDMFIADIGDGRTAVFRIQNSERKSIFKDATYTVDYTLIDYATDDRVADLEQKTIDTKVFVNDFLLYNQNPILEKSDYDVIKSLQRGGFDLVNYYFSSFANREFLTMTVPDGDQRTYDHWVALTVQRFFTATDHPMVQQLRVLNVSDDPTMVLPNIWDAIYRREPSIVARCSQEYAKVPTTMFDSYPRMDGIYYSGLYYAIYPLDAQYGVNRPSNLQAKLDISERLTNLTPAQQIGSYVENAVTTLLIPPVTADSYVFTPAFYANGTNQTVLELLVWKYLNQQPLDNKRLLALVQDVSHWGRLEQFYYIPIILILIKASIRSF